MNNDNSTIGDKLQYELKKIKMSIAKLSRETGISYSYINNLLKGRQTNPSHHVLTTLAKVFKNDTWYI